MRRIVHLSDLHFGRVDTALIDPLLSAVTDLKPDLTVVSGDLTQRARRGQFSAARAFLARLPGEVLCIPGNHDTPLDNLPVRLLSPFGRYRRFIHNELEPVYRDEVMVVAGVNTVNRFSWQRGRIGHRRLSRLAQRIALGGQPLRIAVLHHPLEHGPDTPKRLMRGADRTLHALAESGANLVLSGHLHVASARPFRAVPGLLFVQAGTSLSTRLRHGQHNTFNVLDYEDGKLDITTWEAADAVRGFHPAVPARWRHGPDGWQMISLVEPGSG